jgi:hypothetical protein
MMSETIGSIESLGERTRREAEHAGSVCSKADG